MDLPSDHTLRWIVTTLGEIAESGGEALAGAPLVEASSRHFPDAFEGDAESVARLLARMIGYAPLHPEIEVGLRFVDDSESAGGGGCGTGGCGTGSCSTDGAEEGAKGDGVTELDDGYLLDLAVSAARHPSLLAATLARGVGGLVLAEAEIAGDAAERGAKAELAAVASGFGPLLLEGSYVYGKSCGGASVRRATELGVVELGVALGLFLRVHDAPIDRSLLGTTQKEALERGLEWVDSNPEIVEGLRDRPSAMAAGLFTIAPVRGFFTKLFGKKRGPTPEPMPAKPRRQRTPEEERRIQESRALVDEVLGSR